MAYTIAPLALVFATALAVFGSYQYLKYQEKQDLDQLSLADFWGQTIGPINTELFVSKIQRLQNATSAAVDAQLIALLRAIEAGVCQQQDRHLLCQIMPDLIQLSQLKGTVLCQQTLEKIKQYTIEDNHSERATQYSDNTSSANMPVEQSQIMTEIEELERRVDSSHHDKGVFEKQWYLLQQKISQQLQNTVLTERLDSLYQRYEQKIMRHNSAPTETEDAGPSNKSQQSSTRQ
jgi:hypothetical protein